MAFGRLDIALGADVRPLEKSLQTVEVTTRRIQQRFDETAANGVRLGSTVATVSGNISVALRGVSRELDRVDTSSFTDGQRTMFTTVQNTVSGLSTLTDVVTVTSGVFTTLAAVGPRALAAIAARIPALTGLLNGLLGPWGLIATVAIGAATAIAFNWDKLTGSLSNNEKVTRSMAAAQKEAELAVVPQISKVQLLSDRVNDLTLSYTERNRALNELKSISPTYFSDLDIEKGKVEGLSTAIEAYRDNLINISKVKVLTGQFDDLTKEVIELDQRQKEFGKSDAYLGFQKYADGLAASVVGGFDKINDQFDVKKQELLQQQLLLGKEIAELQNNLVIDGPTAKPVKPPKIQAAKPEKVKEEVDQIANLYEGLAVTISNVEFEIDQGWVTESQGIQSAISATQSAIVRLREAGEDVDSVSFSTVSGFLDQLKTKADAIRIDKIVTDYFNALNNNNTEFDLGLADELDVTNAAIRLTEDALIDLVNNGVETTDEAFVGLTDTLANLNATAQTLTIADTFQSIQDSIDGIDTQFAAGIITEADAANSKVSAIRQGLQTLVALGVDPSNEAFQRLLATMNLLSTAGNNIDKITSKVQNIAGVASQLSNVIGTATSARLEGRAQELESYYQKEKDFIEASYIPEAVKAKKIEELDRKVNKEKRKLQRDEAVANKRKAIFDSIINTAVAVTQVAANPILAGITAALGLAQTAAIASQPIPQLALGGIAYGNTLANVGEYPGASSNPEVIAPLDRLTDILVSVMGDLVPAGRSANGVLLSSVIRGDDLYQVGVLQDYKSKRVR